MQVGSRMPASCCRATLVALALLVGWDRAAAADEAFTVDLDRDGRTELLAVVTDHGRAAIRVTLERGGTVWLGVAQPVRQLIARDLDHDGDLDLLATTEGAELLAWFNHGRGRFSTRVIHPRPHGPFGPRGAALETSSRPVRIDLGIGVDGALPAGHRPAISIARRLPPLYSSPAHQTLTSVACSPRAPPAA
jgi:hypothetical protein